MSGVRHFTQADLKFEPFFEPPERVEVAQAVGPEISGSMAGGLTVVENSSQEYTLHHDEIIVILEGEFTVTVGDEVHRCRPFDILWIPNGTTALFEADARTTLFFAAHPVNWAELSGGDPGAGR